MSPNGTNPAQSSADRAQVRAQHEATRLALEEARERAQSTVAPLRSIAVRWLLEREHILKSAPEGYGRCWCLGRKGSQPVCRCRMRDVIVDNARWVSITGTPANPVVEDLGPIVYEEYDSGRGHRVFMHTNGDLPPESSHGN